MIDHPAPPPGGETHAAYYTAQSLALVKLAMIALEAGCFDAWREYSREASIAEQIARRIRARLALARTPMREPACPLSNCVVCQELRPADVVIASSAQGLARGVSWEHAITEVIRWLHGQDAASWRYADADRITALAASLIHLRDAVEAGRFNHDN